MEELTIILSSILGFCMMFYALVAYIRPYGRIKMIPNARRVLFLMAHPDDETMFFAPTILNLCRLMPFIVHSLLACSLKRDFYLQAN